MSSISDISQFSECSASTSIRALSKKSSTSETCGKSTGIEKMSKLLENCEESTVNYAKLKLLVDCLHKLSEMENSSIESEILNKLKNLMVSHESKKYLQLPNVDKTENHSSILNLLGITDMPRCQFDRNEKTLISVTVEKMFQERLNAFLKSYEESGGKISDLLKNQESAGKAYLLENRETDLIRWNKLMNEVFVPYRQDLEKFTESLSEWQQLKYIDTKELRKGCAENLLLEAQTAQAQTSISKISCTSRMFNETPCTVNAFGMMSEHLDSLIVKTREENKKKEILKMSYADVSSLEYDELLKKNAELDDIIKKKEHLLKML